MIDPISVIGGISLAARGIHEIAKMTGALDKDDRKRVADASRDELQRMIDTISAVMRGEAIDAEQLIPPGLDAMLAKLGGQDVIDAGDALLDKEETQG